MLSSKPPVSFLGRQAFVWLVPSKDGKVKKFSVTYGWLAAVSLLVFSCVFIFCFLATDYGSVQLSRIGMRLSLVKLQLDNKRLNEENKGLSRELLRLKEDHEALVKFEGKISERLDLLLSSLENAAKFELPIVSAQNEKKDKVGGIGGAEIDCVMLPSGDVNCGQPKPGSPGPLPKGGIQVARLSDVEKVLLPERLDLAISLVDRLPLGHPGFGHINSGFGFRKSPFTGRIRMHEGLDYSLPYQSSVYATGEGVVKSVRRNATYGLMIDIDHGLGIRSRYAHLYKAKVAVGDKICRGQEIALVGSSGRSTGPHLHYEILLNGSPINPKGMTKLPIRLSELVDLG